MSKQDQEIISILKGYLEDEPLWVTHSMSLWNRARRMIIKMETGEEISDARSWDKETQSWVL